MSFGQKAVIFIGMLAIASMVAYPPWMGVFVREGDDLREFVGYEWYLEPPGYPAVREAIFAYENGGLIECRYLFSAYIDTRRLTIQILLCLIVVVGGVALQVRSPSRNAVG